MIPKPFSMDTVLKVRKREEDLAQQKFMQAMDLQRDTENILSSAKNNQQTIITMLEKKQQEGILAMELRRFEEKIEYNYKQIETLLQSVQEKKKITEKKREALVKKSQEYNMLKTLKEKQNRAWEKYLEKKEAAMLDEIAILHHKR
jgi:flagellar FliJ protein